MNFLTRWLAITFAILMVPYFTGGVTVDSFGSALAGSILLGILNTVVKPVFVLLTFPFTILTFGGFLLVINAILFQFVGYLIDGIHVQSFGSAFVASLMVSLVSWLLNRGGRSGMPHFKVWVHRGGSRPTHETHERNASTVFHHQRQIRNVTPNEDK